MSKYNYIMLVIILGDIGIIAGVIVAVCKYF